jgi:prepilin-type N-terminal cleavage/methylation domain-containing protein/prepilin-type processing-associated H-X9-DG protein
MKMRDVRKGLENDRLNSAFQKRAHSAGFTLTELLVVIASIAILSAILLPALGQSRSNSQAFQCMENTRRLTLAWRMYAEDNSDRLVYSSDDGSGTSPYQTNVPAHGNQGNPYAWTWSKMSFFPDNPYNWDTNADITLRPLWQYVKDASVYKCPADLSQALHNGVLNPRVRSYSMNFYLGGFGANATQTPTGTWASHFPFYLKLTDLHNGNSPGPNQTFVFIDERSDCINWGNFTTDFTGYPLNGGKPAASSYQWVEDLPASYHNLAACVSFADGHVEIHRWMNPITYPPLVVGGMLTGGHGDGVTWYAPYSQDVAWMQNVSARPH